MVMSTAYRAVIVIQFKVDDYIMYTVGIDTCGLDGGIAVVHL